MDVCSGTLGRVAGCRSSQLQIVFGIRTRPDCITVTYVRATGVDNKGTKNYRRTAEDIFENASNHSNTRMRVIAELSVEWNDWLTCFKSPFLLQTRCEKIRVGTTVALPYVSQMACGMNPTSVYQHANTGPPSA